MIVAALEDAKHTSRDNHVGYIDFQNTFGTIDHARLLAIMDDLGFPPDVLEIVNDIYINSTMAFRGVYYKTTTSINIRMDIIQCDTLKVMYLFIVFLKPLLRWLEIGSLGHHFLAPNNTRMVWPIWMTYQSLETQF